jgi:hypothetical protein
MVTVIIIIAAGVFIAGAAAGIIAVVTLGIRREERRFSELRHRWEQRFIQTGEVPHGYMPEEASDPLTGGARRLTGLFVRHEAPTPAELPGHDLRV